MTLELNEDTMNYTLLIYENAEAFALRGHPDVEKRRAYWAAWPPYAQALREAGVFVAGAGLEPPDTATTFRDPHRRVQDGPYADTKEQLGGFFVIDVPDLDAALEWAARVPVAAGSVVEIRPNLVPPKAEAAASTARETLEARP
ncbi:MAG TPA: YciI family protein [Rudaea sp.]|nr:YciI family protein [Rudaea sp.]